MNSEKGTLIKFVVLLLACAFVTGDDGVRCIEKEREALLIFKNGLTDEDGILSSWRPTDDCCKWYGVVCSNTTSHVIRLDLDLGDDDSGRMLGGEISSSLIELRHLSYLDLSNNYFGGSRIPEFIGSMIQLQHLYLSNSVFSGTVPPQIGNLTSLSSLDLSYNFLRTENLDWLSSLSLLSFLDLSNFDLSHTNWLEPILTLHSLQKLNLKSCNINDVKHSAVNSSSSSLSILGLSDNHFTPAVFDWLSNVSMSLVDIDMSLNALGGLIPNAFERLSLVEFLDLSSNKLGGDIPKSLLNLTHLQLLALYDNYLSGNLNELFGNVSAKGILVSLQILDLDTNQLEGLIPDLVAFSALTELYLGNNKFSGSVPLSLGRLSKLEALDLSNNNLEGTVSESHLINFQNLKMLSFSFNSLTLRIAPDWTPPFQLKILLLAGCLVGPAFPRWIQSQNNFHVLDLSGAGIIDEVPNWLWNSSSSIEYLILSDNQISGVLPDLSSNSILALDLSSNKISGQIPLFSPSTLSLQLSRNMLSGSISSLCNISLHSLLHLDLANNHLSGEIPNCWEKLPNIGFLILANNSFSGEIPHSLGSLHHLAALQLRENNLSGELPSTLRSCHGLNLIDVGENELTGYIPTWMGESYTDMSFFIFRSNNFYGSIPPNICNITKIRILDFSINNLSGKIPDCFNNFTSLAQKNSTSRMFGMRYVYGFNKRLPNHYVEDHSVYLTIQWKGQELEYKRNLVFLTLIDLSRNRLIGNIPPSFANMKGLISLNLSRNSLIGNIIQDIGQMEMLECLDLSNNHLSGQIPKSLENLSFLGVLDLSNNNLSGKIPSSTQLQSFNASSYAGNNGLCGRPMALCPEDRLRPPTTTQGKKDEDDGIWRLSFMEGFIISLALGGIVGFWGVVGSLVLKKSWRYTYFRLLGDVGDWFYAFLSKWRCS